MLKNCIKIWTDRGPCHECCYDQDPNIQAQSKTC